VVKHVVSRNHLLAKMGQIYEGIGAHGSGNESLMN
jgi:hypothetical protein